MALTQTGLNPNDVVNVTISLSSAGATYRNFGATMVVGSSDVIDIVERRRQYADVEGVASDFGTTAPEYLWALEFFSQSPQPSLLYVARWAQAATSGLLHGASLTPAQRFMSVFNAITSGGMTLMVDGTPYALTGLNFSGATTLNGVASTIQTALQTAGATGVAVIWDAVNFRFNIESGTTGTASSVSFARSPVATDSITFSTNPTANQTITLNGTVVTFVASGATGNQVLIGGSLAVTLANLLTFLNASTDAQIVKFDFSVSGGNKLNIFAATPGTGGNSLTVTATAGTVASPTLAGGGAGTDVSVTLGLSATPTTSGATADTPVPGIAAETLLSCLNLLGTMFGDWYLSSVATATPPADADHIAAAGYIQAAGQARTYWITTENTEAYDDEQTSDLGSVLETLDYDRTSIWFSSTNPYAAASIMAKFATINYTGSNTTITGKFKQMPGVVPEYLSENQAATLKAKNYNVYAQYQNGVAIAQEAIMSSGTFIDSRINADWLANYIQVNDFNLLVSQPKLPQTDAGMNLLTATEAACCQQGIVNGYGAPGQWNGPPFGALKTGDTLDTGFYIYRAPVATQSETDRAARKAMPAQIAFKEAGAVHSASVMITVNP